MHLVDNLVLKISKFEAKERDCLAAWDLIFIKRAHAGLNIFMD